MRQISQHHRCLTHRFREQARSHIGYLSRHKSQANHKPPVGASLLAKTSAHPASMLPDPPLSRASSLPHWIFITPQIPMSSQIPVGASLLAKASAHPTSMLPDPPLSRAGSLPHWLSVSPKIPMPSQIPVGASLLAKASVHPASMLPDPPLSRASSLPHWIFITPQIPSQPQMPCRSEPARDSVRSVDIPVA
ncbi:hypothetical protein CLU80_0693 [Pseudomonas sp. 29]|nr:hypothetical protein CLU80_0693 [Pseudomonas sp. 29]